MTLHDFLSWFDEVVSPTESMMRMVPEERLGWKLTDTSFTLEQLLAHIANAPLFGARIVKAEEPPERIMREILVTTRRRPAMTVPEAVDAFHKHAALFKATVGAMGDERFRTGFVETPDHRQVPAWRYVMMIVEHHIHHLMELHLCLKVLGLEVNTGTLYGSGKTESATGAHTPGR